MQSSGPTAQPDNNNNEAKTCPKLNNAMKNYTCLLTALLSLQDEKPKVLNDARSQKSRAKMTTTPKQGAMATTQNPKRTVVLSRQKSGKLVGANGLGGAAKKSSTVGAIVQSGNNKRPSMPVSRSRPILKSRALSSEHLATLIAQSPNPNQRLCEMIKRSKSAESAAGRGGGSITRSDSCRSRRSLSSHSTGALNTYGHCRSGRRCREKSQYDAEFELIDTFFSSKPMSADKRRQIFLQLVELVASRREQQQQQQEKTETDADARGIMLEHELKQTHEKNRTLQIVLDEKTREIQKYTNLFKYLKENISVIIKELGEQDSASRFRLLSIQNSLSSNEPPPMATNHHQLQQQQQTSTKMAPRSLGGEDYYEPMTIQAQGVGHAPPPESPSPHIMMYTHIVGPNNIYRNGSDQAHYPVQLQQSAQMPPHHSQLQPPMSQHLYYQPQNHNNYYNNNNNQPHHTPKSRYVACAKKTPMTATTGIITGSSTTSSDTLVDADLSFADSIAKLDHMLYRSQPAGATFVKPTPIYPQAAVVPPHTAQPLPPPPPQLLLSAAATANTHMNGMPLNNLHHQPGMQPPNHPYHLQQASFVPGQTTGTHHHHVKGAPPSPHKFPNSHTNGGGGGGFGRFVTHHQDVDDDDDDEENQKIVINMDELSLTNLVSLEQETTDSSSPTHHRLNDSTNGNYVTPNKPQTVHHNHQHQPSHSHPHHHTQQQPHTTPPAAAAAAAGVSINQQVLHHIHHYAPTNPSAQTAQSSYSPSSGQRPQQHQQQQQHIAGQLSSQQLLNYSIEPVDEEFESGLKTLDEKIFKVKKMLDSMRSSATPVPKSATTIINTVAAAPITTA